MRFKYIIIMMLSLTFLLTGCFKQKENEQPVAKLNIEHGEKILVNSELIFDLSASEDNEKQDLTYTFILEAENGGDITSELYNVKDINEKVILSKKAFTPEETGVYKIFVKVNDGRLDSETLTYQFEVVEETAEMPEITQVNLAGSVTGEWTNGLAMTEISTGVWRYIVESMGEAQSGDWLAEGTNQAFKFVINGTTQEGLLGSDGVLIYTNPMDMGNIFINCEEGKKYQFIADINNMTYNVMEIPEITQVNLAGSVTGEWTNGLVMTDKGSGIWEYTVESMGEAQSGDWLAEGTNQAFKFVINGTTQEGFLGENGFVRYASPMDMGNIFVNCDEGASYKFTIDTINMTYLIEEISEIPEITQVNLAGSVTGEWTNGLAMTEISEGVWRYIVESMGEAQSGDWLAEGTNQAFKFVINGTTQEGLLGSDGVLIYTNPMDMGNIFVNCEEGKRYQFTADINNMTYDVIEIPAITQVNLAGSVTNEWTNGLAMTEISEGVWRYIVESMGEAQSGDWLAEGTNQAFKFIINGTTQEGFLGSNGVLNYTNPMDMGNMFVNCEEGKKYVFTADLNTLNYTVINIPEITQVNLAGSVTNEWTNGLAMTDMGLGIWEYTVESMGEAQSGDWLAEGTNQAFKFIINGTTQEGFLGSNGVLNYTNPMDMGNMFANCDEGASYKFTVDLNTYTYIVEKL